MKNRCYNLLGDTYEYYGGRGITVCDEWKDDFKAFYDYVTQLPNYGKPGMSLDRRDNDGNYEPGNIRWADRHTQTTNQRRRSDNKSGYTGVHWNKEASKWQAYIGIRGKLLYLGKYHTIREALNARNQYIVDNNLTEYKVQEYLYG